MRQGVITLVLLLAGTHFLPGAAPFAGGGEVRPRLGLWYSGWPTT